MNTRLNNIIRNSILALIAVNGKTSTRFIIRLMASLFGTTRQRISGNISYLVTSGKVQISRNYPHSVIY